MYTSLYTCVHLSMHYNQYAIITNMHMSIHMPASVYAYVFTRRRQDAAKLRNRRRVRGRIQGGADKTAYCGCGVILQGDGPARGACSSSRRPDPRRPQAKTTSAAGCSTRKSKMGQCALWANAHFLLVQGSFFLKKHSCNFRSPSFSKPAGTPI